MRIRRHPLVFLAAGLYLALLCATTQAQPRADQPYRITLRSRSFVPEAPEQPLEMVKELVPEGARRRHVIVQFQRTLIAEDFQRIRESGIVLHSVLSGNAYSATVPDPREKALDNVSGLVRWIGPLELRDKLSQNLSDRRDPEWTIERETGRSQLLVKFFPDVPKEQVNRDLESIGATGRAYGAGNSWEVSLEPDNVNKLVALDSVEFVQHGPIPFLPLNAGARTRTNTDGAHQVNFANPQPAYGRVSGRGARMGICDSGIDQDHDDFDQVDAMGGPGASRVYNPQPGSGPHGTHVASIAGGSGFNSENNGLPGFHLRGHAPESELGDYSSFGGSVASFFNAIATDGTHVTNHSYVQSFTVYDATAESLDKIVRGDATQNGQAVPARPQVWAAGNNGLSPQYGDEVGYHSVFTSAKNTISVGSIDSLDRRVSDFSSLGPTFDGRIKPDVVAPGCRDSIGFSNTGIQAAQSGTQGYTGKCGTSMAAPVVTGIVGLMFHEYVRTYGIEPQMRPSTYKAMLIHSAHDRIKVAAYPDREFDNPDTKDPIIYHAGPDFSTGYGLVDAEGACDLVARSELWQEGTLAATGKTHTRCIRIRGGEAELKVVIAWDDEPGSVLTSETTAKLVNDLDLVLIDPNGNEHLPWTLDPLPLTATPGTGGIDPITTADVKPAYRGVDRRNNVEMVTVCSPMPGVWKARVRAHQLPLGTAQPYSFVSSSPLVLCINIGNICKRYPWICKDSLFPRPPFRIPDGIAIFDPRVAIPIDEICKYVINCPGCSGSALCPGFELQFRELSRDIKAVIFNQDGRMIAEGSASQHNLVLRVPELRVGDQLFLVLAGTDDSELSEDIKARISFKRLARLEDGARLKDPLEEKPVEERFEVKLRNRRFVPPEKIEDDLLQAAKTAKQPVHGLIVLKQKPSPADRAKLAQQGIKLQGFLGGTAYQATFVGDKLSQAKDLVHWAGQRTAEDKLDPELLREKRPDWAATREGRLKILVTFNDDVPPTERRKILEQFTSNPREHGPAGTWAAEIAPDKLKPLADQDAVHSIELGPKPFLPLRDKAAESDSSCCGR